MDRNYANQAFAARVVAERATMITNESMPETWTEICPGLNIKADDLVVVLGQTKAVLGPTTNDPTYFQTAWMDDATLQFTTGADPCGDYATPYITDRAPADPEDTDPIYVEPEP